MKAMQIFYVRNENFQFDQMIFNHLMQQLQWTEKIRMIVEAKEKEMMIV